MAREILFRAKRAYSRGWVEGHLIVFPKSKITKIMVWNAADLDFDAIEVIPETVGQYTGLTDKNGKKIFEGDIVSVYTGTRYEVDFDDGRRGWFPFAQGDGCGCCEIDTHHPRNCEVIGNIHDNPELLKGGEAE